MASPQFPIYICSKGRSQYGHTMHALDQMGVPYRIIVDKSDYRAYANVFGAKRILVLDSFYEREYETCDDLGMSKSLGPGPKRNFAWDHAIDEGHAWHWIIDDNIAGFFRFNLNLKTPVGDGTILRCMEDFVLRYENVGMAGPNYFMFVSRKSATQPPFVLNTRIYSCNLIRNDLPLSWRCRYNEDTDISLQVLKSGWCTVLFNAFLQEKLPTQTVPGGNTADFYVKEGTREKSKMLCRMHPDVTELVDRFGRDHHYVDYSGFRTPLIFKKDQQISGVNNYGMTRIHVDRSLRRSRGDAMRSGRQKVKDSKAS